MQFLWMLQLYKLLDSWITISSSEVGCWVHTPPSHDYFRTFVFHFDLVQSFSLLKVPLVSYSVTYFVIYLSREFLWSFNFQCTNVRSILAILVKLFFMVKNAYARCRVYMFAFRGFLSLRFWCVLHNSCTEQNLSRTLFIIMFSITR